ncbi:large ribosomal subunit protein mL55 isoform 1-T1 [Cyanocitta cristata]
MRGGGGRSRQPPRAPAAARPDVTEGRGHGESAPSRCPQAAPSPPSAGPVSPTWAEMAASRALSALRLQAAFRPPLAACVRSNSNRAAISHLHRQLYGRLYPVLLVNTDGSTVRLRYREPKRILMLPLDSSTLPEAERKARLRRHFPSKPKAKEEETFEGIDLDTYKKFWKK